MPLQKHPLEREFPEYAAQLQFLQGSDGHFQHLVDEYHRLDERIFTVEAGRQALDDCLLLGLKLQRVGLKDEIVERLRQAKASTDLH
ncbi:GTP-binding protein [Pseudomonas sp. HAR-UPW-AIA-41]|uniref:YdcH family protein n=1 Tax=Pseudomonas sp. HAR-UPW-AIA-41 TaxID=1985301 RepID=UPI000BB2F97A|nr:DUF465 domain-containing protein [Pseudomonas sp. HAR-UPW-AIA-41]PAV46712.1 GTP-binding protein [Pseudomonas sp. HAR-UPW-AIA-41]